MSKFNIPIIECEEAGDSIYMLPPVNPVVYIPPSGYSPEQLTAAKEQALLDAYGEAARQGRVGVIRNIGASRTLEMCECPCGCQPSTTCSHCGRRT